MIDAIGLKKGWLHGMKNELISIVIPMYNTEDYIEDCLRSVQKQSYTNFECLIVDDGSTDDSYRKATAFALGDPRFCVICQEHSGVSYAVSNGVERANGQWLYFLDSDDWIDADELQHLYQLVTDNGCDMAVSNYIIEAESSEMFSIVRFNGVVTKADFPVRFYPQFLCNGRYIGIVCGNTRGGKLIRKTLAAKNTPSQEGMTFAEDAILMLGILCDCSSVCADISHAGYHYRKHSASSMHNYGLSYVARRADYAQKIRALYEEKGIAGDPKLEENYWQYSLYNVLGSLQAIHFDVKSMEKQYPQTYVQLLNTIQQLSQLEKRLLSKRDVLLLWMLQRRMFWPLSVLYGFNHFLRYKLKLR